MFNVTSNAGQAFDIAHLIQIALTPIFLISAIGDADGTAAEIRNRFILYP